MLKKSLVYILCLPFASISLGQQLYDIKDLEVLDHQKNFEEFLLHVNDIRPSERGNHWKAMYQSMGIELIDYKIKTKDFSAKSFAQIELIGRSSALAEDEFYQIKRDNFAKKYFAECFKKAENKVRCENELSSYWYFSNKDPDIGLELAAILEANNSSVSRWPYYQAAINGAMATIYCAKPTVQKAIVQKIKLETFKNDFDDNYKTLLDKYIPNKCFNKMVDTLRDALISSGTKGEDKELAISLLDAKKLLTPIEQDLYSVLYLLDGPVVGDKMNIAWKRVEAFGDIFSRRQKILEAVQKLDLLPDGIFKDPNLPRHKAIINLFARNFPEFLNYYGKSCLDFINRKSNESSNIASSYQCHQFLKTAKTNSLWISDSIQSQYSAIKK